MSKLPSIAPPRWPLRLLRRALNPNYLEELEGDLEERFYENLGKHGPKKARRRHIWGVIKLLRPALLRNLSGDVRLNQYGMLRNYFKVTWRNLAKQKLYASINIGGLALGLTCFLLVFLYVQHELSFDQFYRNSDEIYRVFIKQPTNYSQGTDRYASTPAALPSVLMAEYPKVKFATSVAAPSLLLEVNESESYLEKALMADENYFRVFEHEFIQGNPESALSTTDGIVLTESLAAKLFGEEDPMGKRITFSRYEAYVTGVIKDLPTTSSLSYSCLINIRLSAYYREEVVKDQWNGNSYRTFLSLEKGTDVRAFEEQIQQVVADRWLPQDQIPTEYLVSPLSDLHLQLDVNEDFALKGNPTQLVLFSVISILVLVLACVNYMNLAIARSIARAKEVGMRKVLGASKGQLTTQFLLESVTFAMIALVIALIAVPLLLPVLGHLMDRTIHLQMEEHWYLLPILVGVVLTVGLLSGSHPAFFMSSLPPIKAIFGKLGNRLTGQKLQRILIACQYAISMIMAICSLVIYYQFQFIGSKELGFNRDQILTFPVRGKAIREKIDVLKNDWKSHPNILGVTTSNELPTDVGSSTFLRDDQTGGQIYRLRTDYNFLEVFEMELVAGRNFSPQYAQDKEKNYIINETAAKALGWTAEEAIGRQFTNEGGETKTVVGVVRDFHMQSMHQPIAPLMIQVRGDLNHISIKIRPENIGETISYLQETIEQISSYPLEYRFLDDHFNSLYQFERQQGELIGIFTLLAIVIACLGLFGLAAFNVRQRMKEIGIRKVLGASIESIVVTFSKSFMILVLFGFFVAVPVGWYLVSLWLDDFAYRIEVEWWMFVAAGLGATIIALLTISSQSIKASLVNPVECLRDE
ncbi:MAG: ABC transporter permease [Bacteroidota bacterium]